MSDDYKDYFTKPVGILILLAGYIVVFFIVMGYYNDDHVFWRVAEDHEKFFGSLLAINSLWLTGRLVASKIKTIEANTHSIKMIVLKNIISPIIVSVVVFSLTGSTGITLVSIPIFGFLSASLGV